MYKDLDTTVVDNNENSNQLTNTISQEKANELIRKLRVSQLSMREFSYIITHDFREPLRANNSYLQLIENKLSRQLDDELEEYFTFVRNASNQLDNLICSLWSLSYHILQKNNFSMIQFLS